MPKILRAEGSSYSRGLGGTSYVPLANTLMGATTPTSTQSTMYEGEAGYLSVLSIYINDSGTTGATPSTMTVTKGGVASAVAISIPTATTGKYSDTTHQCGLAVADTTYLAVVIAAGGTYGIYFNYSILFTPASGTPSNKYATGVTTTTVAAATVYLSLGEFVGATETNLQTPFQVGGVHKRLQVVVSTNTVTLASTVTSRKNAGAGAMSVSVTASTTGTFRDLSNSDTVIPGDLLNLRMVAGATGTSLVYTYATDFTETYGRTLFLFSSNDTLSATGTSYFPPAGSDLLGTESFVPYTAAYPFQIYGGQAYVITNTRNGATTITARKNNADSSNISISITASTTGSFRDTSTGDTVAAADEWHYRLVTSGSSGSIVCARVTSIVEPIINSGVDQPKPIRPRLFAPGNAR